MPEPWQCLRYASNVLQFDQTHETHEGAASNVLDSTKRTEGAASNVLDSIKRTKVPQRNLVLGLPLPATTTPPATATAAATPGTASSSYPPSVRHTAPQALPPIPVPLPIQVLADSTRARPPPRRRTTAVAAPATLVLPLFLGGFRLHLLVVHGLERGPRRLGGDGDARRLQQGGPLRLRQHRQPSSPTGTVADAGADTAVRVAGARVVAVAARAAQASYAGVHAFPTGPLVIRKNGPPSVVLSPPDPPRAFPDELRRNMDGIGSEEALTSSYAALLS